MNATRTTLPRKSESRTGAPAASCSAKSGAGAITLKLGRALSAKESSEDAGVRAARVSCAHAVEPIASETRKTIASVEQHVMRTCRTGGRLGEVDAEDGIELHPAVGTDVDQAQRIARRK